MSGQRKRAAPRQESDPLKNLNFSKDGSDAGPEVNLIPIDSNAEIVGIMDIRESRRIAAVKAVQQGAVLVRQKTPGGSSITLAVYPVGQKAKGGSHDGN